MKLEWGKYWKDQYEDLFQPNQPAELPSKANVKLVKLWIQLKRLLKKGKKNG